MQLRLPNLVPIVASVAVGLAVAAGLAVAPTASADCNSTGSSTLCASGTVRGPSGVATNVPAYSPYPCSPADPTCYFYNSYDPGDIFDPPNIGIGIGGPGGPVDPGFGVGRPGIGGGGGIGPR